MRSIRKDRKTLAGIAASVSALALLVLMTLAMMPISALPVTSNTQTSSADAALTSTTTSGAAEEIAPPDEIDVEKILPKELTSDQLAEAKAVALADAEVKRNIGNKQATFMSYDFVGNIIKNPGVWNPEVRYKVDEETVVTAIVDLKKREVTKVQVDDLVYLTNHWRSFASDYFSGTEIVTGYYMKPTAPTYTVIANNRFTAHLVNGFMFSSDAADVCTSGNFPYDYWAQAGFVFTNQGGRIAWTDTRFNCAAQYVAGITYAAGDDYRFRVYTESANNRWVIYLQRIGTGEVATTYVTGLPSYTFETSEFNSGVFFENSNPAPDNNWDNQFTTDPTAKAYYRKQGSDLWRSWSAETQQLADCNSFDPDNVIDGGFHTQFGNQATWDMTDMANYFAC